MPVHGVKGELLTRNRTLVPLAAARRECWYFFPRRPSFSRAPIVLCAHSSSGSLVCVCIEPPCAAPSTRAPIASAMRSTHRDVDRILSIEPSASGAGKKAAYDVPGREEADDLAVRGREIGRIGEKVLDRDVRVAPCEHRDDAMRIRKCISRVKEHDGAQRTRALMS
jgi:hypothetical protein